MSQFFWGMVCGVALAFVIWKGALGYRFHYHCAQCGKLTDPRLHPIYHQQEDDVKTVKTLHLGPEAPWDEKLDQMKSEVARALIGAPQKCILRFSVHLIEGGHEKLWQYAKGSK